MNREEYGAAIGYLNQIVADYPSTPFAEEAKKNLQDLGGMPAVPQRHFQWLADMVRARNDPVSQLRNQVDPIKVPDPTRCWMTCPKTLKLRKHLALRQA